MNKKKFCKIFFPILGAAVLIGGIYWSVIKFVLKDYQNLGVIQFRYLTYGDENTEMNKTSPAYITGIKATDKKDYPDVFEVPSKLLGHPVVGIDANAFKNLSHLKKVILPKTVEEIGDYAFSECPQLEEVVVKGNLTSVGNEIFRNSKWETIQVATPSYIPAILTGTATITCIFGANLLNKHQQASLMSAYALINQSFKDYKAKVADLYGEDTDREIRAELAKDEYEEYEDGKLLYYDEYSKRYFRATKVELLKAEYEINKILNSDECACLNEFYQLLGLEKVDYGEYVGWSCGQMFDMYWSSWVDFWHEEVEMEDGMECTILRFTDPFVDFEDY